ncbi:MAG: LuxR family transcriptional regulator [Mycobacteriales bacterium]
MTQGLVSFLLTDIQGSTRLWELYADEMAVALAVHDRLAAETVAASGGVLVKQRGEGDSTFSVFTEPTAAVWAAVAFQRALQRVSWPGRVTLSVRAAVHTGAAELRDGDYFGSVVNRAARLRAAGHGGQTLLGQTTAQAAASSLPTGVTLRDLGSRRLKDLAGPEHVFEVVADDLPRGFPPLKTLDDRHHNLPAQPTPFLGRMGELDAVLALLRGRDIRLVTLTGPGGTGKTRLALQVGAEALDEFEDGVCLVALAGLSDAGLIAVAVAGALGIKDTPGVAVNEAVARHLSTRHTLLVLDNMEHLVEGSPVVAPWLAAAPRLKVLATSRVGLRLRGEHIIAVPPMDSPTCRDLFYERAHAAGSKLPRDDATDSAVSNICAGIDRLPLAIELVAARLPEMSLEEIVDGLPAALHLATMGPRDAPSRHQALADTIAWSYNLLSEPEQELFGRLSVFRGGWTLQAAQRVHAGSAQSLEPLLRSLVSNSLVQHNAGRYAMLETVRAFAADQLNVAGQHNRAATAHLSWMVEVIAALEARMHLPEAEPAVEESMAELDNLRAAYDTATRLALAEPGLALTAPSSLWIHSYQEGLARIEQVLALPGSVDAPFYAQALVRAAALEIVLGRYSEAAVRSRTALAAAKRRGDPSVLAAAHCVAANVAWPDRDWQSYAQHNEAALSFAKHVGDVRLTMIVRANQAMMLRLQGDPNHLAACREILAEARQHGQPTTIYVGDYAEALVYAGDFDEAIGTAAQAIDLARAAGDRNTLMLAVGVKAHAELMLGRLEEAVSTAQEILPLVRREPIQEGEIYFRRVVFATWLAGKVDEARVLQQEFLDSPYAGRPAWADDTELAALGAAERGFPLLGAELLGVAAAQRQAERTKPFALQERVRHRAQRTVVDALGQERMRTAFGNGNGRDGDAVLTDLYLAELPGGAPEWPAFPGRASAPAAQATAPPHERPPSDR